jgi:heptosyltransferase III
MKSILVLRPGAIGDAILAFPVLKALREQYDGTRITFVSNPQVLPLAEAFGVAEQTFDFQNIQWSELFSSSGIRTSSLHDLLALTDLAICWMRDPDGIIEHNLKTLGVKHPIIAPGRPSAGAGIHIVDYLARTIGLPNVGALYVARNRLQPEENLSISVGARVDDMGLDEPLWSPVGAEYSPFIDEPTTLGDPLQTTLHAQDKVTKLFVAIHPGSGSAEKCWPAPRFAQVIKRLWEQNYPILVLAGPADTECIDDLLKHLSYPPISEMFKLLTKAPLLEVAHQLQQCRCYLGNDSGITHLAAMLGVPTVAIFGPTDPKIWRPVGPFVRVIQRHMLEDVTVDDAIECLDL